MTPYVDQLHAEINTALWEHFQGSISTQGCDWATDAVMRSPLLARIIGMIEHYHRLVLGEDGWTIEHPLACRLDGIPLHECETHVTIAPHVDRLLDEWSIGTYRVWLDDGIWCGFDGSPDERAQILKQGEQ